MRRLPNILTLARVILAVIFFICLMHPGARFIALAIFLFSLASLTDYYDGYFAKKHNVVSNFGKIMDPIADKFLILAAFYIFFRMGIIFAWMFYAVLVRELFVTGTRIYAIMKGHYLAAERAGKMKTVSQIVSVFVILIFIMLQRMDWSTTRIAAAEKAWLLGINIMMVITVVLTLFSGFSYLWNNRKVLLPKQLPA